MGLFRVALFFAIDPLWDWLIGTELRGGGAGTLLDRLWPGVTDVALVSFIYLLLFDAVDYGVYHRAQHGLDWWW